MPKAVKRSGSKTPLATKIEFLEWFIGVPRRGTQGEWAKAHGLAQETLSRWIHDDDEFRELMSAVGRGQEQRFPQVIEAMYRRALDPDAMDSVQAATFLAKVFGKFAPDKVSVSVDRVAYVQPDALRVLSGPAPEPPRAN